MRDTTCVPLEARAVAAQPLESGRWVTIGVYGDETEARIAPFDGSRPYRRVLRLVW